MKKVYLLPNCITAFGLTCGLFVIFRICMTDVADTNYETIYFSAIVLMVAAFADLMDGAVARAMKAESEFGEAFDSLADAVSFGVAPAVITLKTVGLPPGSELSFVVTMGAMIYSVCGILRLVRFTVQSQNVKEDRESLLSHKKNFTGLPIPAAAAALVSVNLLLSSSYVNRWTVLSQESQLVLLMLAMIVLGYFMVSHWKFPSLKTLQIRVASFQLVFATAVSTVVLFYGLIYHFSIVFFVLSWGYVAAACVLSGIRIMAGRKSKTLIDFEPDSDAE